MNAKVRFYFLVSTFILPSAFLFAQTPYYYLDRSFSSVQFDLQGIPTEYQLNEESDKLTDIVAGEIVLNTNGPPNGTYAIEKQAAIPICYPTAQAAWNAAVNYSGTQSNYPGKIFDNVGWVRGTKNTVGGWGAYLWVLQNKITFQSSATNMWISSNGIPVAITNVMVGSLGDYGPVSNVVDIGPSIPTNYPGANQSTSGTYQVDITNVFYELVIPDIWITPRETVACVGNTNPVQFSVTGTNIPQGVSWTIIPDLTNGAEIQSNSAWQAAVILGNIATNYKVRATSVDNTNFYDQVDLPVCKVEVEKCNSSYLPKGGSEDNTTAIRAFVTPNTVKGKFKFTLFDVSDEKGYCMNAPTNLPASGEDSDSWKDFRFPSQTGFTISGTDSNIAETVSTDLNEATVTIKSYDYGSFGKIKAEFTNQNVNFTCVAKETDGTNEYTRLPADTNGNCIADSWGGDTGPGTSKEALDDTDNCPAGDGADGDQLSRYQEYRGFIVQGVHVRTDPTQKDVFCRNHNVEPAGLSGFLTSENLGAPVHAISDSEWTSDSRRINQMSETYTLSPDLQTAIKVENINCGGVWGITYCTGEQWVPNNLSYCWVDVAKMQEGGTTLYGPINSTTNIIMVWAPGEYRDSGAIKIDDEITLYSSKIAMAFAGCTRGAMGTTAASHTNNANVANFANVDEAIQAVFGHEAGHVIGLGDFEGTNNNHIMNGTMQRGSYLNNGYWSTYAPALTNKFRVKP